MLKYSENSHSTVLYQVTQEYTPTVYHNHNGQFDYHRKADASDACSKACQLRLPTMVPSSEDTASKKWYGSLLYYTLPLCSCDCSKTQVVDMLACIAHLERMMDSFVPKLACG